MERIKLAIEKAKAGEGDSTKSAVARLRQVVDSESPAGGSGSTTQSDAVLGSPIAVQYSQTAVVQLDAAHLERHRVVSHQKAHPASWAFDVLRTQVLQKMDENGWRTLAITSPSSESGKTVVSSTWR